ncbi:hypothetical protein CDIMF43_140131 [Carnobacterium divergens]|nr:hypothetical protein CDIMF43_140131 [Carnobacterium divergens]
MHKNHIIANLNFQNIYYNMKNTTKKLIDRITDAKIVFLIEQIVSHNIY